MLFALPENMDLIIMSLCPGLPGVFLSPPSSTKSLSCVLRGHVHLAVPFPLLPEAAGRGTPPMSRVPGSRGQACFVVKPSRKACGFCLKLTKPQPPGLCWDGTTCFL